MKVILFGTGDDCQKLLGHYRNISDDIVAFADNDSKKWGDLWQTGHRAGADYPISF